MALLTQLCTTRNPVWRLGSSGVKLSKQSMATVCVKVRCMQFNEVQKSKAAQNCNADDKRQMNPECCKAPCPEMPDRYDDVHYTISDKAKRVYQQAWIECPKLRIVPRPVCCYEELAMEYPSTNKRQRLAKKRLERKTAAPQCRASEEFLKCAAKKTTNTNEKCAKMCLPPPCKCGRNPPTCVRIKMPADCIRICTPYPSFSECEKAKPRKLRPIECRCLTLPALCDMHEQMQKLNMMRTKY